MGNWCSKREKNILVIDCCIPVNDMNKEKRKIIGEIIENFEYSKPIKYILQSSNNNNFSINLSYNNKERKIEGKNSASEYIEEFNNFIEPCSEHIHTESKIIIFPDTSNEIIPSKNEGLKENIEIRNTSEVKINEKKSEIKTLFEKKNSLLRFTNSKMQKIEILYNYGFTMEELINLTSVNTFFEIEDLMKPENKQLFALGLLAKNLKDNGLETFIEKDEKEKCFEEVKKEQKEILEFITNGIYQKKKYVLKFDFEKVRVNFKELKDKLETIIIEKYEIPKNEVFLEIRKDKEDTIDIIFLSDEYNNLDLTELKNNNEIYELQYLKQISKDRLIKKIIISKNLLDSKGDKLDDDWGINEMRGNAPYDPPLGWTGIGLKVANLYDNGDNSWINMDNNINEWCVAYCKVGGHYMNNDNSNRRNLSNYNEHKEHEDIHHLPKIVGEGILCTPIFKNAVSSARIIQVNRKKYKILLMVRVKYDAVRECNDNLNIWTVNGNSDEIRPYRILYKEI
jgi:hypothetical protein